MNSQEAAYGFGALGSAYLADTDIFEPPTGQVIVSIISSDDDTAFTKLEPVNDPDNVAYFGTTNVVTENGTNADALPTDETFPSGTTIYGRWNKVQLNGTGAAVVLYFGY